MAGKMMIRVKTKYNLILYTLLALSLILCLVTIVQGSELGGYISEKLLRSTMTTASSFVIARTGVNNSHLDVATCPTIVTLPATWAGTSKVRFNGTVTNLNNFPRAYVYFEWGNTPALGNATGVYERTTTGNFSVDQDVPAGGVIYFRAAGRTDGTGYGAQRNYVQGSLPVSRDLLYFVIPIGFSLVILIIGARTKSWQLLVLSIVAAILGIAIVKAMLNIPFRGG